MKDIRVAIASIEERNADLIQCFDELRRASILIDEQAWTFAVLQQRSREPRVRFRVGAAKRVDRLLRIAHHGDPSGDEVSSGIRGEPRQNLRLDAIGILKLIDEDEIELIADAIKYRGVSQKPARAQQEAIEIEEAA